MILNAVFILWILNTISYCIRACISPFSCVCVRAAFSEQPGPQRPVGGCGWSCLTALHLPRPQSTCQEKTAVLWGSPLGPCISLSVCFLAASDGFLLIWEKGNIHSAQIWTTLTSKCAVESGEAEVYGDVTSVRFVVDSLRELATIFYLPVNLFFPSFWSGCTCFNLTSGIQCPHRFYDRIKPYLTVAK